MSDFISKESTKIVSFEEFELVQKHKRIFPEKKREIIGVLHWYLHYRSQFRLPLVQCVHINACLPQFTGAEAQQSRQRLWSWLFRHWDRGFVSHSRDGCVYAYLCAKMPSVGRGCTPNPEFCK